MSEQLPVVRLDPEQLHELAGQVVALARASEPEPYLTKVELAAALACGVRSIEGAMKAGMPHALVFGRAKFLRSEVVPWLERHGYIERRLGNGSGAALDEPGEGA